MNQTGQEIVRQLLELPAIVRPDGTRDRITMDLIREHTQTGSRDNVYNWLRGKFDPQPQHLFRLRQLLLVEKVKRQSHVPTESPQPEVQFAKVR